MDGQPGAAVAAVATQPLSVWVADDDERTAQVLSVLLRMDGHAADFGPCTRILERLAQAPMPDVVIMVVSMGRSDAVRRVAAVRERAPSLPIVIITEHPQLVRRLGPQAEPEPEVFTKPVEYPALLAALRMAQIARSLRPPEDAGEEAPAERGFDPPPQTRGPTS